MNSKLSKIIGVGLLLSLLFPLVVTPFTFFSHHFGKTIFWQILVEILVFLWLVGYLKNHKLVNLWTKVLNLNKLDWLVVAFLLVLIVSAFLGVNFNNSFWGNQARASGIFTWLHFAAWYFLCKSWLKSSNWQNKSMVVITAVLGLVSLSAIFQKYLPTFLLGVESNRAGGLIGSPVFLGAYLISALGFAFVLVIILLKKETTGLVAKLKSNWPTGLVFLVIILGLTALLLTKTRGAYVGLFLGTVFFLFLLPRWQQSKKTKWFTLLGAAVLVVGAGGMALFSPRLGLPAYLDVGSWQQSSTGATRLMAWEAAIKGWQEKPILGWGWGNYEIIFNKFYNPQFMRFGFGETVWDKPHNWILEIGSTAGGLGLLAYLLIYVLSIYYLIRQNSSNSIDKKSEGNRKRLVGLVLASALVANLGQSLFLFETNNNLMLQFFILALTSASYIKPKQIITPPNGLPNKLRVPVSVLLLVALVFSILRFNVVALKVSYYLDRASKVGSWEEWNESATNALAVPAFFQSEIAIFLAEQFVDLSKSSGVPNLASVESSALQITRVLEENSKRYANNINFPAWAGQVYSALGEVKDNKYLVQAEKQLKLAQTISPAKQEILFLLSRVYLLETRFDEAIAILEEAVKAAPEAVLSHWFLGLARVASGDVSAGILDIEEALNRGYQLNFNQRVYLVDLYTQNQEYDKVILRLEEFLFEQPDNINWHVNLATANAKAGNKTAALAKIKEIAQGWPHLQPEVDKFIVEFELE